ncbi:Oligopeptide transport system permease protein OppC [subsurface metagenome]
MAIKATNLFRMVVNPNNLKRRLRKWGSTTKIFSRNWMGVIGLVMMVTIIILAIIGPDITDYDPYGFFTIDRNVRPNWDHLLGTNGYGQDVFTILLESLRVSLLVGVVAGSLTVLFGTTIGVASAYIGGWVDTLIMRITDVILVLPALPLMLVLASIAPLLVDKIPWIDIVPQWFIIASIYIIVFWPVSARLIRSQALSLKQRAFITGAKASGASRTYIIFKHILPNVFPLMLTMIITSMRQAILYEAFLSYLGLGDPLTWTLGQMLHNAQVHAAFASGNWWLFWPPGIAIGLITLSFAFVGMAFDEIVNPRLRQR